MNRSLTALFAAFEALLVAAIGIAIPLAPLTVLWGVHYEFAVDWAAFWRASVDIWLLGHGADVAVQLDPAAATALGLGGADRPFTLSIAASGFALLTVLLGVRAGRRVAETRYRLFGEIVSVGTFGLIAFGATFSALYPLARPSLVQGTLFPTAIFALGVLIGSLAERRHTPSGEGSSLRDWINDWPPAVTAVVSHALRGGAAAVALVVAVSAVMVTGLILVSYSRIISIYEGLHTEVLGGITVTLAQVAFLPNLVVWAACWLVGPGFAIGVGSTVSPLATQLGPIPAIPLLGALPTGDHAFGFLCLLVPVLAGFFAAVLVRHRPRLELDERHRVRSLLAVALGMALVAGCILGLLAWFSAGTAGPGRLAQLGPDPVAVAAWTALEVGVGSLAGVLATARGSGAKGRKQPR